MRAAATLTRPRLREARAAALAAIGPNASALANVQYRSRGCVLVAGDASSLDNLLNALSPPLKVVAFASGAPRVAPVLDNVTWVPARVVTIDGHLGHFTAHALTHNEQPIDCAPYSANADGWYDLVLDLHRAPLLDTGMAPPGYFAPQSPAELERAIPQIRASVGMFERPRHIEFQRAACRHTAVAPCARCVTACPAGAISDVDGSIVIDAHRCGGCGLCDGVCQRGALRYTSAPLAHNLSRLFRMIDTFVDACGIAPRILVHRNTDAIVTADVPADVLPFAVPAGHALRGDTWLAALSREAHKVLVYAPSGMPLPLYRVLEQELDLCRRVLRATGCDPECVEVVRDIAELAGASVNGTVPRGGAWARPALSLGSSKRVNFLACADALNAQHACSCESIALPEGAPVGRVELASQHCNACGACVDVCASAALVMTDDTHPHLQFIESRCGQCGLCVSRCPQHAISLMPRLQLYAPQRDEPSWLT